VAQAYQKVIRPELDAEEPSLSTPRFDEVAAQQARPVVPLPAEVVSFNPRHSTNLSSGLTAPPSRKGLWLLAAFLGVVLAAGVMAIGVNTLRRDRAIDTQSLATVAEATRIEINADIRPKQSLRTNAPVRPQYKRRTPVAPPVSDGRPGPRLVDSYVIR
jgi:hypothetical protein